MVAVFPSLVRECVILPPPFPLSLWTLLRRLPSVWVCQPPTGFLPLGSGRSFHPGLSGCFRPSQLFFGLFFCLCPPPPPPRPPPTFLFSLSLDSPFCSVDPPHTFSLCLSGTPRQITSICLSDSPIPHSSTVPFLLQTPPSFLFVSEDALSQPPPQSSVLGHLFSLTPSLPPSLTLVCQ